MSVALAIPSATWPLLASAQVYRCESDSGVPVYQGSPSGKNCRQIDLQPLTTIPAPKLPASPPRATPAPPASSSGAARNGARQAAPADFPRVDAGTQRARDNDRRAILEAELSREQARLDTLRAEYKDGEPDRLGSERNYQKYLDRVERLKEDIARAEANIGALQRELSAIRE